MDTCFNDLLNVNDNANLFPLLIVDAEHLVASCTLYTVYHSLFRFVVGVWESRHKLALLPPCTTTM